MLLFHLGQLQGLLDGVAHRLFQVDVLAGLDGIDGQAGVPVIGSGDEYGIDLGVAQHLFVLLHRNGRRTEIVGGLLSPFAIDIAGLQHIEVQALLLAL